MGDEIGGHNVSGHVHTTAHIQQIENTENNKRITFQVRGFKMWPPYSTYIFGTIAPTTPFYQ